MPHFFPYRSQPPLLQASRASLFLALLSFCPIYLHSQNDKILLKSGQEETGRILKLDKNQVHFEKQIGAGSAILTYDLNLIEKLTFTPSEDERKLLLSQDPQNITAVETIWQQRRPFLPIPESDAWQWGLQLARLMLELQDPTKADPIENIIQTVAEKTWLPNIKEKTAPLLLQLALLRGETEKALNLAQELSETAPDNLNLIAESKWVLALSQLQKVKELETEFPRWSIMPEKTRERRALIDAAIDNILFPVVFIPDHQELVARSFHKLISIYMVLNDRESAIKAAQEIVNYYPHPTYLPAAKDFLIKNPPPQDNEDPTTQDKSSPMPDQTEKNKAAPPLSQGETQTAENQESPRQRPAFLSKKDREKLQEEKKKPKQPKN
ncbi:MAG: hypothetical protein NZM04_03075 [Methylacidiphilales bacterium]|nr:hypothetical protein [Candidatus Methylacidiphilales bacterium]